MTVGIPACARTIAQMPFHRTPARHAVAALEGAGALPALIPSLGERMLGLLDRLARILGTGTIIVNSVHGQAVGRFAPGLVVEATAPDGTIEAVAMPDAPCWLLGVQWRPEWAFAANPHGVAIFRAFGDACRKRAAARPAA